MGGTTAKATSLRFIELVSFGDFPHAAVVIELGYCAPLLHVLVKWSAGQTIVSTWRHLLLDGVLGMEEFRNFIQ